MNYIKFKDSVHTSVIFIGLSIILYLTKNYYSQYISTLEYVIFICLWLIEITMSFLFINETKSTIADIIWYFTFACSAGGYICLK